MYNYFSIMLFGASGSSIQPNTHKVDTLAPKLAIASKIADNIVIPPSFYSSILSIKPNTIIVHIINNYYK